MILHLEGVLTKDEVARARAVLDAARWEAGARTAGPQATQTKNNLQLPEDSEAALSVRELLLFGLRRHPLFFSAALPKDVAPPMFNRYGGQTNAFGDHVDASVRFCSDGRRVRTDLSSTVFLSEAEDYEGGELVIADHGSERRIKYPAGDAVLYPGNTVHRVEPVTQGERVASFTWIQSMVRSNEQRDLLFDMDLHLMRLRSTLGEADFSVVGLTSTYHNLLRTWAEV